MTTYYYSCRQPDPACPEADRLLDRSPPRPLPFPGPPALALVLLLCALGAYDLAARRPADARSPFIVAGVTTVGTLWAWRVLPRVGGEGP